MSDPTSHGPRVTALLAIIGDDVILERTCAAFPEQYDLSLKDGRTIAYFRLRGGRYTVEVPDCGGERVYERTWPDDQLKGDFADDERDDELAAGLTAVLRRGVEELWTLPIEPMFIDGEEVPGTGPQRVLLTESDFRANGSVIGCFDCSDRTTGPCALHDGLLLRLIEERDRRG